MVTDHSVLDVFLFAFVFTLFIFDNIHSSGHEVCVINVVDD